MDKDKPKGNKSVRPPIVVVMGHIDHGKSTLLDYIRKTNVVEHEAGGITQRISAYEVTHKDEHGADRKITFLDTPGHEAFSGMRERGVEIADIAILVVSAEDGVKPQTIEAWKTATADGLPVIVAINKIDKEAADIERTKMQLAENEIYLEGYGGKIPFAPVSARTGAGVDELLTLINIMAELEGFAGDPGANASGAVIEANLDPRRGIEATLVIKNGTLRKGMAVAAEGAVCPTKIMENFLGDMIKEATFSSPIRLVGFDKVPRVGAEFRSFENKDEALEFAAGFASGQNIASAADSGTAEAQEKNVISIILKADVAGMLEAIEKEIDKIKTDRAEYRIIQKGAGPIGEADVKALSSPDNSFILGFAVKADRNAVDLAEKRGIQIILFDIIYKMTDWLKEELDKRTPPTTEVQTTGRAKILKSFSRVKDRQVLGGKVTEGVINSGAPVKIIRRESEIAQGKIAGLQKNKDKVSTAEEGTEFGMMLESRTEVMPGDTIECLSGGRYE